MFKRFTIHHPPIYYGTPNPNTFEDLIGGMEKPFDALQYELGFCCVLLEGQS